MSIIYFLFLLSFIIAFHEFGHLIVAKLFNVYCYEYSLGMGPLLFSYKGKETRYSLRLLPLGGYVSMAGDSENALETYPDIIVEDNRTLKGVSKFKRILIMLAGIFMNFLLGFIILSMVILSSGRYASAPQAIVKSIAANSPASKTALKIGDKIIGVQMSKGAYTKVKNFENLSNYLLTYEGKGTISFYVNRNNEVKEIDIKPIFNKNEGRYLIGIEGPQPVIKEVNIFNCFIYGFKLSLRMIETMILSISQLVRGIGLKNLAGPVGIYKATSIAAANGLKTYLLLMAMISLNIGFMNILPLPILDGGRVFLTLIEIIIRKPLSKKVENTLMIISTVAVLILFIYSTFNDILRLF